MQRHWISNLLQRIADVFLPLEHSNPQSPEQQLTWRPRARDLYCLDCVQSVRYVLLTKKSCVLASGLWRPRGNCSSFVSPYAAGDLSAPLLVSACTTRCFRAKVPNSFFPVKECPFDAFITRKGMELWLTNCFEGSFAVQSTPTASRAQHAEGPSQTWPAHSPLSKAKTLLKMTMMAMTLVIKLSVSYRVQPLRGHTCARTLLAEMPGHRSL